MSIRLLSPDELEIYESVSPRFLVQERLDISALPNLEAVKCMPRWKDYDEDPRERPSYLRTQFDLSNWKIGFGIDAGCIVAPPGIGMIAADGAANAATLHDLRVAPEARGRGRGRELIRWAAERAREMNALRLVVETQDTNVPACRCYLASGFELARFQIGAYPGLDEAMLIWSLRL